MSYVQNHNKIQFNTDQYTLPEAPEALSLGILPPAVQRNREIQAILSDPRIYEKLGHEMIVSIEKTEHGYIVRTENHTLDIDVHYLPHAPGFVGPARFEFDFAEPAPRGF